MRTSSIRRTFFACLCLAAGLLTGCSLGGSSNTLTFFPSGHQLLDEARAMREAAPIPAAVPRELDKQVLPAYTVEPGDVLLVQPVNLDSPVRFLGGDLPILPDGTINLGQYGMLTVAGKTVPEIEDMVAAVVKTHEKEKAKDIGPIGVRLVTRVSKVYYVLGEVNAPGAFPLSGRETVLDGILTAGGLNDRGSRTDILLVRPTPPGCPRVVLPVCYRQIVQLGDTSTNYQLAPGDRIYVPTRSTPGGIFHKKKTNKCQCNPQVGAQIPAGDTSCPHAEHCLSPFAAPAPAAPTPELPVVEPAPPK